MSQSAPPKLSPEEAAEVRGESRREYVSRMFDSIAPTYDFLNLLISFGQTSWWRWLALRHLHPQPGQKLLDVGCGTGLMLRKLKRRYPSTEMEGLDVSEGMLAVARDHDPEGSYFSGDVCNIPREGATFDWITTIYTLRNFPDLGGAIAEMLRVLKPGGRIILLDAFPAEGPVWWRNFHTWWLTRVVPRVAGLFSEREAYTYLGQSIFAQIRIDDFVSLVEAQGGKVARKEGYSLGTVFTVVIERTPPQETNEAP